MQAVRTSVVEAAKQQGYFAHHLADHDEPCPRCGYNLRGLIVRRCPECGSRLKYVEVAVVHHRGLGVLNVLAAALAVNAAHLLVTLALAMFFYRSWGPAVIPAVATALAGLWIALEGGIITARRDRHRLSSAGEGYAWAWAVAGTIVALVRLVLAA
jgi:hypothetical protein